MRKVANPEPEIGQDMHSKFDQQDISQKFEVRTGTGVVIDEIPIPNRLLTQNAQNTVRRKQLEAKLKGQTLKGLLTPDETLGLNWPVVIGEEGRAIALYASVDVEKDEQLRLARGGFGGVYLGIDLDTGEQFAVKKQITSKDNPMHHQLVMDVEKENENLKQAGSYVDQYKIEDDKNTVTYSTQKLIMGESLHKYLDEKKSTGSLPLEEEIDICLGVVESMQSLNSHGLLHRDIKTDQIIWDTNKKKASITDLGLAIPTTEAQNLNEIVGNYPAVPPELWAQVTRIKDTYHVMTDNGCEQGEKTEVYGTGTILADVLDSKTPSEYGEMFYRDMEFYKELQNYNGTDNQQKQQVSNKLREIHQPMFERGDKESYARILCMRVRRQQFDPYLFFSQIQRSHQQI